jgi:hypothetical protein
MLRGEGGAVEAVQGLPLESQRKLLLSLFSDYKYDLDEILNRFLYQSSIFALPELEDAIFSAVDAEDALTKIAELFSSFMIEQQAAPTKTRGTAKGEGRHFAAPWFVGYLAREGIALWPIHAAWDSEFVVPRVLKPLLWTFFVPEHGRELACKFMGPQADLKNVVYVQNVYKDLLWTTNYFEKTSFCVDHLLHLKGLYHSPEYLQEQKAYGVTLLFKLTLDHYGLKYEDVGTVADFFGGGRRIASDHGREAFGWVERPKHHRLKRYKDIIGREPPDRFPDYVERWAADLRSLLAPMDVQAIESKINELNVWLLYLISVGEEYAPKSWLDINREKHINSGGNVAYSTFVDFAAKVGGARAQSYISTLKQAWTIAATHTNGA